LPGFKFKLSSI